VSRIWVWVVMIAACLLLLATCFLRVNASPSMPRGVWIETRVRHVALGDVVVVCLPPDDYQRRYLSAGDCPSGREPVLKPVVAIEGDLVTASENGIGVNGAFVPNSRPMQLDGAGRELRHVVGTWIVDRGHVWLVAPRQDSFDSRYLGAVGVEYIRGQATPLLVWP